MSDNRIAIAPLAPLLKAPQSVAELDYIFFEAARRQRFCDEKEKAIFRERWLGRYLGEDANHGFAAVETPPGAEPSRIVAYVVGSYENPAQSERFADLDYFQAFAHECCRFPAHLHINIRSEFRAQGIGSQLLDAFCTRYARSISAQGGAANGAPLAGVHVVTSAGARNVSFYYRNGFSERARLDTGADVLLFLARDCARNCV